MSLLNEKTDLIIEFIITYITATFSFKAVPNRYYIVHEPRIKIGENFQEVADRGLRPVRGELCSEYSIRSHRMWREGCVCGIYMYIGSNGVAAIPATGSRGLFSYQGRRIERLLVPTCASALSLRRAVLNRLSWI